MPIFKEFTKENVKILIWKYDENEDLGIECPFLKNIHPKRQKEILMVRKMLSILLPRHELLYQENGEPYLNPADRHISISHSFPFAVVAVSDEKIGIDLEEIQPKLEKIKNKYLYKTEYDWIEEENELEYLTLIWSIKEALYKIHSMKYWSFREHYEIEKFNLTDKRISCSVFDERKKNQYFANFIKMENFYLTIVKEKPLN
ncbi:MAG: 4'-phosphopantetheinyl transferase superfamily protein [Flavobacteriaceae bacterium]|nr:4'-phosphopantetheinyl transferase superfamily protein [Flavobacteriaceae bacterium]